MRRWLIPPIACVFLASCLSACSGSSTTAPSPTTPIRLTAQISQTLIPPGGTATLTFRLENVSSNDLELTFPASCQIVPYISQRDTIVYPGGGGWACATVITRLALPAGGAVTHEVFVRASDQVSHPYVSVAPGEYAAYAKLADYTYRVVSPLISFTVR